MADDVNVWGDDSPSLLVKHRTLLGRASPVLGDVEFIDLFGIENYRAFEVRGYNITTDLIGTPIFDLGISKGAFYYGLNIALSSANMTTTLPLDVVLYLAGLGQLRATNYSIDSIGVVGSLDTANAIATLIYYDSLKITLDTGSDHLTGEFYLYGIDKIEP